MNNLRKVRANKGITQEELAEMSGITRTTIVAIEYGRGLSPKTALKLAKALNCNVFEILGEDMFVILPETEEEWQYVLDVKEKVTSTPRTNSK